MVIGDLHSASYPSGPLFAFLFHLVFLVFWGRARCSSVVRVFADVICHCIDHLWWTHRAISRSSQYSTIGVTKIVVCVILSVG